MLLPTKSFPHNLTSIRLPLALLVILFHVFLVVYLTRTRNDLSRPSVQNISLKTHVSLPNKSCHSRWIYVYDLPPMFNYELLTNCNQNKCIASWNDGFELQTAKELAGILPERILPAWYWTDQYWGEVVYHNRMLNYKCRTREPESATAFYIPFYAGLALRKYSWSNHAEMLNRWVQEQKWWKRFNGSDHFIMLGRQTWDFRRSREDHDPEVVGSSLLNVPAMENVIRLLVERSVWDNLEIAVPYPTTFHPRSESDIIEWQRFVRSHRRNHLFTFVGGTRDWIKNDFRAILRNKCLNESTACLHVDCGRGDCVDGKTDVMESFLNSDFCLQPRGDTFTRRAVFDCMLAGSIPVFFWRATAHFQYELFMPIEDESYSVFLHRNDVLNGTDIRTVLEGYGRVKVESMREKIIENIPRFVYVKPSRGLEKIKDAFDISIEGVLSKYKSQMERGRSWNKI